MALGFLAVHFTKKLLRKVPIIGTVTRPVVDILPTLLIGPALGAAIAYGVHEGQGDLLAARGPVKRELSQVSNHVGGRMRELNQDVSERLQVLGSRAQRQWQLEEGVRQLEAESQQLTQSLSHEVTPILERRTREARQQLEQLRKELHSLD